MSTDKIAGELTQLNEILADIGNSLRTLSNERDFYPPGLRPEPKTFGDLVESLPDPDCPECEPCIDMDHQKGYE
tara:strand:- start:40 stop:261 length:222 start_codon:yes stop_codon:yes gene_type:complete